MFLSLDGIDGVGKSTQLERLVAWLESEGKQVLCCRDPGSTPLGETLRDILLHSGPERPIGPTAEMLLYMAARAQLVEELIRPALEAGKVVIADRYLLANIVYQAYAGGLDRDTVAAVGEVAVQGLMPDRVIILDLDPEAAAQRRGREADRMESRGDAYRERLRAGYLAEAERDPEHLRVVCADQSIEAIEAELRGIVTELIA